MIPRPPLDPRSYRERLPGKKGDTMSTPDSVKKIAE
jgi:hypothetical protein